MEGKQLEELNKAIEEIKGKVGLPKGKRFGLERKGYKKEEVDPFLESILSTLRSALDLLIELQKGREKDGERIRHLEERLKEGEEAERELKETILMAKRLHEKILEEGRRKAMEMVSDAERRVRELKEEIASLSERRRELLRSFSEELKEVMRFVESLSERDIVVGAKEDAGSEGAGEGHPEENRWDILLKPEEEV